MKLLFIQNSVNSKANPNGTSTDTSLFVVVSLSLYSLELLKMPMHMVIKIIPKIWFLVSFSPKTILNIIDVMMGLNAKIHIHIEKLIPANKA